MNRKEMLLMQLSEECSEVSQAVSKIFRFGSEFKNPYTGVSNIDQLRQEIIDVLTLIDMCKLFDNTPEVEEDLSVRVQIKMIKVEEYLVVSEDAGQLEIQ